MLLLGDCGHALMMALHIDPGGNPPSPTVDHTASAPRPFSYYRQHDMRRSSIQRLQKPSRKLCHDWIFSSSTNVHVAIDRPIFTTYTDFDSYVLSLADQRKIEVKGIGSVELTIHSKPGSNSEHTIVLENVLHIPSWLCNIFSDVYFMPLQTFEHIWTESGVNFMIREKNKLRHWGHTKSFCGLDKLVLGRRHDGRSPMLDDKDREVYSVNVIWPKGQQDAWQMHTSGQSRKEANVHETLATRTQAHQSRRPMRNLCEQDSRSHLADASTNTTPGKIQRERRITTLKAAASSVSLFRAATIS